MKTHDEPNTIDELKTLIRTEPSIAATFEVVEAEYSAAKINLAAVEGKYNELKDQLAAIEKAKTKVASEAKATAKAEEKAAAKEEADELKAQRSHSHK